MTDIKTNETEQQVSAPIQGHTSDRLDYIDIAKGIAILLVIVGHTFSVWKIKINWIFTFHMPLFFILSGYFFKSGRKTNYKKLFKTLILPYLGLNILRTALQYIAKPKTIDFGRKLLGILYANASAKSSARCLIHVPVIGMTWFLLALFWCRVIYSELDKLSVKYRFSMLWATIILAVCSLELTKFIYLPFSLMPGITAMLFYHFGRVIKEKKLFDIKLSQLPPLIIALSLILWICSCSFGFIRLNQNRIHFLTDILSAVIGTYYVVILSKQIIKIPVLSLFLKWCGKNSLVIFGFHSLDGIIMYELFKVIPTFNKINSWCEYFAYLSVRIGVVLLLSFAFVVLKKLITNFIRAEKIRLS